jgi:hypothetical protein
MTAITQESEGEGHARYTYRLRVSLFWRPHGS